MNRHAHRATPTQARAVKMCGYCKRRQARADNGYCSDECERKRRMYTARANAKQHAALLGSLTRPVCPVCGMPIGVWSDCECPKDVQA